MQDDDRAGPRRVIGSCSYDLGRSELADGQGRVLHLRPQAARVLEHLLERSGRLVTRDELMGAVWPGVVVTDDSLVQCIGEIRRALGADGHQLLKTVPRRGYLLDAAPTPAPPQPSPVAVDGGRRWWSGRRPALAAIAAVGAVGLVGTVGTAWFRGGLGASSSALPASLAVLPAACPDPAAKNDGQPGPLAAGFAVQLVADLARNTEARLIAVPFRSGTADDRRSVVDLARRLGASHVLEVCARVEGAFLVRDARLLEGESGRALWTDAARHPIETLSAGQAALLRQVARSMQARAAAGDAAPVLPALPRTLQAHVVVTGAMAVLGRFDRDEYRDARSALAVVLQAEPGYAQAWAVAGALTAFDAWAHVGGDPPGERSREARAQLERALALDSRLQLAHLALSLAWVVDGRNDEALKAAGRALQLAPRDPLAPVVLANALVANGRSDEAIGLLDAESWRWPAASPGVEFVRAKSLWGVQRLEASVAAASRCLEQAPQFTACYGIRAVASDAMDRLEMARTDLKAYRDAAPGDPLQGPGSYSGKGAPKLLNDWLAPIRAELGLR